MQRVNKCIESQLSLIHPQHKSFKGQLPNVWGRNQRIEQQTADAFQADFHPNLPPLFWRQEKYSTIGFRQQKLRICQLSTVFSYDPKEL